MFLSVGFYALLWSEFAHYGAVVDFSLSNQFDILCVVGIGKKLADWSGYLALLVIAIEIGLIALDAAIKGARERSGLLTRTTSHSFQGDSTRAINN